ncbi:MAG: PocR ligand-binding domain-containing protein [Chloroflexota bacterium]
MDALLSAKQVQELLNVDRTTIYRMLKDGRLTGVKVGQHWRFSSHEVNDLLSGAARVTDRELPVPANVLPLHCMQPIQDVFAEIAEVGAVTTDHEGHPLTRVSNSCDFCKLILGSDEGRQSCAASWRKLVDQKDSAPEFTSCHAGLQYARARIEVGEELIAILVTGQFYVEAPDAEEEASRLRALSRKYQIDENLLAQAARRIPVLDSRKVSQIGGWLERVAHTFEEISSERANLMSRLRHIAEMSAINS